MWETAQYSTKNSIHEKCLNYKHSKNPRLNPLGPGHISGCTKNMAYLNSFNRKGIVSSHYQIQG